MSFLQPDVQLITTDNSRHFFDVKAVSCQVYTDKDEWEVSAGEIIVQFTEISRNISVFYIGMSESFNTNLFLNFCQLYFVFSMQVKYPYMTLDSGWPNLTFQNRINVALPLSKYKYSITKEDLFSGMIFGA